ncbi:hypothetical protein F7725_008133 [Dissostichus mawsoni]|uniref:Uncharacterized protein n=1 Tax=Dissostichus mawsoni TaxID=36200 RepID=A0A7J5Y6D9_DISMA|nr:hypothetical protein F7725_008133 [Dissostichus mawsoni]
MPPVQPRRPGRTYPSAVACARYWQNDIGDCYGLEEEEDCSGAMIAVIVVGIILILAILLIILKTYNR